MFHALPTIAQYGVPAAFGTRVDEVMPTRRAQSRRGEAPAASRWWKQGCGSQRGGGSQREVPNLWHSNRELRIVNAETESPFRIPNS